MTRKESLVLENLHRAGALEWSIRFAAENGVTVEDLIGYRKPTSLSRTRHRWWAILRDTLGLSAKEMERLLRRDHTSILYGYRRAVRDRGTADKSSPAPPNPG